MAGGKKKKKIKKVGMCFDGWLHSIGRILNFHLFAQNYFHTFTRLKLNKTGLKPVTKPVEQESGFFKGVKSGQA